MTFHFTYLKRISCKHMKPISRRKLTLFTIRLGMALSLGVPQILFSKPAQASIANTDFYCGTYGGFWGGVPATMATYSRRRVTLRTWSHRDDCEYFSAVLDNLAHQGELTTLIVGRYRGRKAICAYAYYPPNRPVDCSPSEVVFTYGNGADMRGIIQWMALLPGESNNSTRHSSARYRSSRNGQMLGIDVQGWLDAAYANQY